MMVTILDEGHWRGLPMARARGGGNGDGGARVGSGRGKSGAGLRGMREKAWREGR